MAYTGLQNEFNAILDAAAEPQQSLIADSTPNSATTAAVNEAINGSDSAKAITKPRCQIRPERPE